MPELLVLQEYGDADIPLTSSQARTLRNLADARLTILPTDTPDRRLVRASSYVGTIVTPDVRILIKPKVATANLFLLLESSGRALDLGREVFDYDQTGDLIPSFATFYARHLEAALSHGVHHEYREHQERLSGIRARVDLSAQRRLAGLPLPVECRFDEYTADTHLNRLLRGALVRLLHLPGVTVATRQALHRLASRLGGVAAATAPDLRTPTTFNRLNEHCRPAERLARIALSDASLQHASGTMAAAVFLVDMNKVFEQFVEARLRRYLEGELTVRGQRPTRLDDAGCVRMKPDLVFGSPSDEAAYVADSKYKVTADGFGREADYYQLLAYTAALDLPEGLLVYCQHDGSALPRQIVVQHLRTRLRTWALRLDRTPADVERELRTLATEVASRSRSSTLENSLSDADAHHAQPL